MTGTSSRSAFRTKAAMAAAAALAAVLLCAGAFHSFGCATIPLPAADSTHVALASKRWHGTTAAELDEGRSAYRERCSGCHSLYAPGNYTEKQWDTLLPVMVRRARTDREEGVRIEKYLRVFAKKQPGSVF